MSNPDTFTTLIDLLPNPHATFVANFDGIYLLVDCNCIPSFGEYIVTPNLKLREYQGRGTALGVVLWVIADLISVYAHNGEYRLLTTVKERRPRDPFRDLHLHIPDFPHFFQWRHKSIECKLALSIHTDKNLLKDDDNNRVYKPSSLHRIVLKFISSKLEMNHNSEK